MAMRRIQIAATIASEIDAAVRARAKASGKPYSRELEAAARVGLPELAPIGGRPNSDPTTERAA